MRDSNQHIARTSSPQHRHLVVAHGDAEATEQARIAVLAASYAPAAEQTAQAEQSYGLDEAARYAAELLLKLGRTPEDLACHGAPADFTAEVTDVMDRLSSPQSRLALVPDLEPEAGAAI